MFRFRELLKELVCLVIGHKWDSEPFGEMGGYELWGCSRCDRIEARKWE